MAWMSCVSLVLTLVSCQLTSVVGHGRLVEPPSRSSAWRYGFDTPHNYNDHELYCGGFARQWQKNEGKCGPCGDPWDTPRPRANEAGGKYGTGVIVRKYKIDQVIHFGVELTANHYGYFEFRLCPNNNPRQAVTNACFDKYVLQNVNGGTRYYPGPGAKKFLSKFQLPKGLTCSQCVVQWRYVAGNNWGTCENGTGMVGCGPQEQFRACADIKIVTEDGWADDTPVYVPEYDDYNDIDVDTQYGDSFEDANHVGHIVAITLAFLLITLILVGVIIYFYCAHDAVKRFIKKHAASRRTGSAPDEEVPQWKTSPPSVLTISNPKAGFVTPPELPQAPPRRARTSGVQQENTPPHHIHNISPPNKVTINGVAVAPTHSGHPGLHAPE
ncbi:uncharacterized protein LOC143020758 [Oratosquilla oratoria]|uniref:uncharacterized protein LOC143020758 n=1 Tax=Oratosquilla oratoria TaxID=337810 RepID=UPI003F75A105